ncbi:MAG TPA: hypothetical protein VJ694_00630 [Patescibacteria group bacterium]|nr:hypothetical protein [Patescibacteria group bacterium]
METRKLARSVSPRPFRLRHVLVAVCALSLALNVVQQLGWHEAAQARDVWQQASFGHWKTIDEFERRNADLERRLDEMTKTAGAYRSYEVYHDCVQQNLGVYQVREVKRAYDQFFRTTELSSRCLAESAWYETHPVGINPAHLHR